MVLQLVKIFPLSKLGNIQNLLSSNLVDAIEAKALDFREAGRLMHQDRTNNFSVLTTADQEFL